MAFQGGCACGAVRYAISRDACPGIMCCHCLDCQTRSGSAFDMTAFVDPKEFELTGPLAMMRRRIRSGNEVASNHCSECQTLIYDIHSASPGKILLRAGTLDDSQAIAPSAHMFTKRKQAWLKLPSGVPAFEEFPSPDEFLRVFQQD